MHHVGASGSVRDQLLRTWRTELCTIEFAPREGLLRVGVQV